MNCGSLNRVVNAAQTARLNDRTGTTLTEPTEPLANRRSRFANRGSGNIIRGSVASFFYRHELAHFAHDLAAEFHRFQALSFPSLYPRDRAVGLVPYLQSVSRIRSGQRHYYNMGGCAFDHSSRATDKNILMNLINPPQSTCR
jgi:hypothetical protein